ncbi:hypothetical protein F5B19DRAFT_471639 [Rostrohypoxylon terebratum]|nr:hypothetical protein F5B19DRAFT_471639 [Rostrohypoxylon terebratum]
MASINTCSDEILVMVVDCVYHQSPKSLDNLALVNKRFHRLVVERRQRSWIFRHGNLSEDLEYIKKNEIHNKIRRLGITDFMAVKPEFLAVLAKMEMLRDIEMVCGFGHRDLQDTFIKHLQRRPDIRLHLNVVGEPIQQPFGFRNEVRLKCFEDCVNLYSLRIKHSYKTFPECSAITIPLKMVLLTCPNLKHLKIDIKKIILRNNQPTHNYCGFRFLQGQRLPATLKTLEIIAYPFGKMDSHISVITPTHRVTLLQGTSSFFGLTTSIGST